MNKAIFIFAALLLLVLVVSSCATEAPQGPEADDPVDAEYASITLPKVPTQAPPAPTATPEPCPITDEEIVMLAQTMYQEAQVVYWNGTKYGVSYIARQAAVGWCGLNRLDNGGYGETLAEVLSAPYQFAWIEDAPATDHFLWLARDVVDRWWAEKQGADNVGRTLPADYLFFEGDGRENHFRKEFKHTGETWGWTLPDPYEGGQP